MRLGDAGLKLLQGFETLRLVAYPDPGSVDGEPWTIGWGTTGGVSEGDTCTRAEADTWLHEDVAEAAAAVRRLVTVPLTQNQFDALVCFVYNVGIAAFKGSTLRRKLNQGDYVGARMEFKRWNKNDGKVMAGLTRRRKAEEELFLRVEKVALTA